MASLGISQLVMFECWLVTYNRLSYSLFSLSHVFPILCPFHPHLVGGLEHEWMIFPYFSHHIGNFIITDELSPSFFRGVGRLKPPSPAISRDDFQHVPMDFP